jgi:glycosyltransferase involved in cell wall biosynthesis
MADRQGLEPTGPEPWRKYLTGGSDDHSGVYTASAHTITPYAEDVDEFLAHLRRGDHRAGGGAGCSVMMGHSFYHIGYSYYKSKFLDPSAGGRPTIVGQLFKKLIERAEPEPASFGQWVRDLAVGFVWSRKKSRLSEVDRVLVDEFSALFSQEERAERATPPMDDRRTFQIAGRISHTLGYNFLRRFEKYVRQGRLMESLQTVASLGPVALSMAPYLAAFSTQHKDEAFHQEVADRFPAAAHLRQRSKRKAWITDTFSDINGVARTIQTLAGEAHRLGHPITVITCQEHMPETRLDVKNFRPIGTFQVPEYESQHISFPPFLDVLEYIERHRFNELIISTPGPLGLTALAAARLLGLRTTGIYHTDFPLFVRMMTEDEDIEELTWKFMQWFYEQAQRILVPSEYYRRHLIDHHFEPTRLDLLVRGVDTDCFNPSHRHEGFYGRHGLNGGRPTFVYVGRVSIEKNLRVLVEAFRELIGRGVEANLAIVGDGPYLDKMRSECRGLPVAFTGVLRGEELSAAYASADVMVFPSESDTFGNAVLEAQASGLPAIVSNRGGPPDIVRPHESGLIVDMRQPGALTDAMEQLAADVDLRRQMGRRGLTNAAEQTWSKVLDQFLGHDASSTHTAGPGPAIPTPEPLIPAETA